jgi:hypothetical protein
MTTIQKESSKCCRDVEKLELLSTIGGNADAAVTVENSMVVPQKYENRTTL